MFTALCDYGVGPDSLWSLCIVGVAVIGFGWIGATTKAVYYAFLVLFGFFAGSIATLPAMLLPYVAPRPEVYASRLGFIYAGAGVGLLIGAPIANATNKGKDSFLGAQLWTGITLTFAIPFGVYTCLGARRNRLAMKAKAADARVAALKPETSTPHPMAKQPDTFES